MPGPPNASSTLGARPPANHPLLPENHQSDPARSHHHWEVFPGSPWHTLLLLLLGEHCFLCSSLHSFPDWTRPEHKAEPAKGEQVGSRRWDQGSSLELWKHSFQHTCAQPTLAWALQLVS